MGTIPPIPEFVLPANRSRITREPDVHGRWTDAFPDAIGWEQQGGGKVPEEFGWKTNPKQDQEELTDALLRAKAQEFHALEPGRATPALPEGPRRD